jgi:hypothetical protein
MFKYPNSAYKANCFEKGDQKTLDPYFLRFSVIQTMK